MPVKLRLQRKGRKKQPFYHIVAADARAPRDGRFIERLGTYNPMTKPATIELDREKSYKWLRNGAQPTETVRSILRFKGVLYLKHLQLGVEKGALTQEQADEKFNTWLEQKEAKVAARFEQARQERDAYHAKLAGLDQVKSKEKISAEGEEAAKSILGEEATEAIVEVAATEVEVEETETEEAPATENTEATVPSEDKEQLEPEAVVEEEKVV